MLDASVSGKVPFEPLARAIARLALASSRNAKVTLVLILALTAFFINGATQLHTNVDVADVLPRGDYNTTAAKQLTKDFKSAFTQQVTIQFTVDDRSTGYQKWTEDNAKKLPNRQSPQRPGNITDEVYVRAVQQFTEFFLERTNYANVVSISELYSLINWTVAGGKNAPESSYRLPDTSRQGSADFERNRRAADAAIIDALDALASPSWTTSAVLITPRADERLDLAELGAQAIKARNEYLEWAEKNPDVAYQVFTGENKPLFTVELPIANAHSSALTREDFGRLLPLIAGFILACLFVAFRNVGSMLIAGSSLAIGVIWTYGLEGYLGIPLNPLNLTLMPLIMGVGIDYSIHVVNEFLEHKAHGMSDARAFKETGRRAGVALTIATVTTAGGLSIMIISPSLLIAQYGALAVMAIVTIFIVALTFIPAALTLWPGTDRMGQSFKPSALMAIVGRGVTKLRWVAIAVVLTATVIGAVESRNLKFESFGDPGRNYLSDDPIRIEHEEGLRRFYEISDPNVKANVIAFVGDVTTPEAHAYMRKIEESLLNPPTQYKGVIIGDTLRTIPFLMETWLTVKDGGPGALQYLAEDRLRPGETYPTTQAAIKRELDDLYASPMRELGSIFTNGPNKEYSLGVMTFSARAANYDQAVLVWDAVWSAIYANNDSKPADLKVAFVGNTATNYLFVKKEIPWLNYMGIISNVILLLVAIVVFRTWRAVITVSIVSLATTTIWLGILPYFDVGLAITLVLPLIFIISLGTDYVIHLLWSFRVVGDNREVLRTVGKAILFSFITTVVPFIIFMGIQDLSVRKTMLATTLAIGLIFTVTLLVVPALYKIKGAGEDLLEEQAPAAPSEPGPPMVAMKRVKRDV
jgi:predicted RND superfamily exporter protein